MLLLLTSQYPLLWKTLVLKRPPLFCSRFFVPNAPRLPPKKPQAEPLLWPNSGARLLPSFLISAFELPDKNGAARDAPAPFRDGGGHSAPPPCSMAAPVSHSILLSVPFVTGQLTKAGERKEQGGEEKGRKKGRAVPRGGRGGDGEEGGSQRGKG